MSEGAPRRSRGMVNRSNPALGKDWGEFAGTTIWIHADM
jgi:hypothetical protein